MTPKKPPKTKAITNSTSKDGKVFIEDVGKRSLTLHVDHSALEEPTEFFFSNYCEVRSEYSMIKFIFGNMPSHSEDELSSILEISTPQEFFISSVWPGWNEIVGRVRKYLEEKKINEYVPPDVKKWPSSERNVSLAASLISVQHISELASMEFYIVTPKCLILAHAGKYKLSVDDVRPVVQVFLPTSIMVHLVEQTRVVIANRIAQGMS